jgi:hypothetical protein
MFDTDLTYTQTITITDPTPNYTELNRLLSALIKGYQGEKFNLTNDEYRWLISIQAVDLASFATQLLDYQNTSKADADLTYAVKIPAMSRIGN